MRNLSDTDTVILKKKTERIKAGFALSAAEKIKRSKRNSDDVQMYFEQILKAHHAVGASMVLVHADGGQEVFCYGKARCHPKVIVDRQTCFRIASVTKLVSTFGILALAEDGLLSLDEDISGLLGFRVCNPHFPGQKVTLRMLLTHTSGIRNVELVSKTPKPLEERLKDPEIWCETFPGENFLYSNLAAGLAGTVAEHAGGCDFNTLMQKRVFGPLGVCAAYGAHLMPGDRMIADGYSVHWPLPPIKKYDAIYQSGQKDMEQYGLNAVTTVGRLITDPDGMAAFIHLLGAREDTGILKLESIKEMRTCQDGISGVIHAGRGLNVSFLHGIIPGHDLVGHQGVAYGMCSELFVDPSNGSGIGIMINGVQLDHNVLQGVGVELLTLGCLALEH